MTTRRIARPGHVARRLISTLGVAITLLTGAPPATRAADEPGGAAPEPPTFQLDALPYAWIPATYGTIGVHGTTVRLDVGPDDVLTLLFDGNAFAAAGYFTLSYDRFSIFADSIGGYMEPSVAQTIPTQLCCTLTIDAKTRMKFALTDAALAYQLGRWTLPSRERPFTLDVYAGARTMWVSNEVDAKIGVVQGAQRAANVYDSVSWADPLIGVRWSAPLLNAVSLDFRGDIGGFGASSDLTWGLASTVRVWLPWTPFDSAPYLAMGYRVVGLDRSSGTTEVDLQLRGPVLGLGFVL
jgi:hypothetical protein